MALNELPGPYFMDEGPYVGETPDQFFARTAIPSGTSEALDDTIGSPNARAPEVTKGGVLKQLFAKFMRVDRPDDFTNRGE